MRGFPSFDPKGASTGIAQAGLTVIVHGRNGLVNRALTWENRAVQLVLTDLGWGPCLGGVREFISSPRSTSVILGA